VSSSARDAVLARVRESLARGRAELARRGVPEPELPGLEVPAEALGAPTGLATQAARVEFFVAKLESVGGRVRRCSNERDAVAALRSITGEAQRFAVSDDPLVMRLADTAFGPRDGRVDADAPREDLLACEFGITSAQHGIAETGTLVLASGAERNRLISLVPDVHVAVLRAERILPDLRAALAAVKDDPAVTFITGPSRTGDIELTLVVGVHGPKELFVLLLDS
jgi:L-lactate dehydrogenase complex protein LldG